MVANTFSLILIVTLIGVCSASVHIVKRQGSKCEFPPEYEEKVTQYMFACFKEVNGKDFDLLTLNDEDTSGENEIKLKMCIAKKLGLISQDGQKFMMAAMNEFVDSTLANDIIKTQIKEAVEDCVTKGGDPLAITDCSTEACKNICQDA